QCSRQFLGGLGMPLPQQPAFVPAQLGCEPALETATTDLAITGTTTTEPAITGTAPMDPNTTDLTTTELATTETVGRKYENIDVMRVGPDELTMRILND